MTLKVSTAAGTVYGVARINHCCGDRTVGHELNVDDL